MFLTAWHQGEDLEPWLAGPREWLEAQPAYWQVLERRLAGCPTASR
jgi:hypothetical protein